MLTGINNVNFIPAHHPNKNVCGTGGCDLGKKPFLVAGGKINIDALVRKAHSLSNTLFPNMSLISLFFLDYLFAYQLE